MPVFIDKKHNMLFLPRYKSKTCVGNINKICYYRKAIEILVNVENKFFSLKRPKFRLSNFFQTSLFLPPICSTKNSYRWNYFLLLFFFYYKIHRYKKNISNISNEENVVDIEILKKRSFPYLILFHILTNNKDILDTNIQWLIPHDTSWLSLCMTLMYVSIYIPYKLR